ncbi:MAG TPA: hypothetical protein VFM54_16845, partial [Micromonosporaceae bacterium]|nr:hypothetical protein [Micromonosporaceae bacterium]
MSTQQTSRNNPLAGFGPNEWVVEEMYQRYLADPQSVDPAWHDFFADYKPAPEADDAADGDESPAPAGSATTSAGPGPQPAPQRVAAAPAAAPAQPAPPAQRPAPAQPGAP